jgi:hypothetical protein
MVLFMEKKQIFNYSSKDTYCILVPVYYDFEEKPAWRRVFVGSKKECEQVFDNYPDILNASYEENLQHRNNKRQEYLLLLSIGKNAQAEKIKAQYNF